MTAKQKGVVMMELYQNPLVTRYASQEMLENFSDDKSIEPGVSYGLRWLKLRWNWV